MFTFVLWKGGIQEIPTHKIPTMADAIKVANNLLPLYSKIQIILNEKAVVKEFLNPTL